MKKSLPEHERLVLIAPYPRIARVGLWALLLLGGGVPALGVFGLAAAGILTGAKAAFLLLMSTAAVVLFVTVRTAMQTTEFGLTDQRIIIKTGFIRRDTNEIPLQSLENVNLRQSVFARLFGFGHLEINGSGGSGLCTHPMQDPVGVRAAIAEARIATERTPSFKAEARLTDEL